MKLIIVSLILCIFYCQAETIEECLQKDSIACVQKSLYKRAKEFFEGSYELFSGVNLVKRSKNGGGRSVDGIDYEVEIDRANDVAERQSALENYIGEEISQFFHGRSLKVKKNKKNEDIT